VRSQDSLINDVVVSRRGYTSKEKKSEYLELPLLELEALATATNNFSNDNKLGQGGFGIVYKVKVIQNILKIYHSTWFHCIITCVVIGKIT